MRYLLVGRSVRFLYLPTLQRPLHPFRDFRAWWSIYCCLLKERPQILHTHTAKAGTLGRLAGWMYRKTTGASLRMVHTFHGHALEGYFHPVANRLFCGIERWLARGTDTLIAVSDSVKEDLMALKVAPDSKIRVVSLGLPLEEHLRLDPPRFEGPIRIGIVGRLVPIKNHPLLFEAIRLLQGNGRLDHAQFWVVGDGYLRSSLQGMAQEMGILDRVRFLGWISQMPRLYQNLQILCLTSRNEGTPVSIIEAMAAARPVVATDVGGVRDLLGKPVQSAACRDLPKGSFELCERGLLVRSGDASGLARALEFLTGHPETALQLGETGRRFARDRFSVECLARNLDHVYRELVPRSRSVAEMEALRR